MFAWLFW